MARALVIGRFQPFHLGHLEVVRGVARDFDRVVVGVGSAQVSHTLKNPFTAGERHRMIRRALEAAGVENADIIPIPDLNRNALWVRHVETLVPPFDVFFSNNALPRRLFHEAGYEVRSVPMVKRGAYEGTAIRRRMTEGGDWESLVPPEVAEVVREVDGEARLRDLLHDDRAGGA